MKLLYLILISSLLYANDSIHYQYYKDGTIQVITPYKNNKEHGIVKGFFPTGQVQVEIPFVHGIVHGEAKAYHENGTIYNIITYKDNKPIGSGKWYYDTGELESMAFYKNGEKHDTEIWYYKDGSIKSLVTYNNGVFVNELYNASDSTIYLWELTDKKLCKGSKQVNDSWVVIYNGIITDTHCSQALEKLF